MLTRAAPPRNPIAIALPLNLIGEKSINACTRAGKDVDGFSKWYTRRLNALIHLDVAPSSFSPFRDAMGRTFVRACQTSTKLKVPDREYNAARVTQQASLIHRDVHARITKPSTGTGPIRSTKRSSKSSRSPRARRGIHVGTGTPPQSSLVRRLDVEPPARNHTVVRVAT